MHSFYRVATGSPRLLGADKDGVVRTETHPQRPVFLLRLPARPTLGFMFTPSAVDGDSRLTIEGVAIKAAIQPWRVRETDGGVVLHDPAYGNVLTAADDGNVKLRTLGDAPELATLQLSAVPAFEITPAMGQVLQALEAVLPTHLNGPDILDVIASRLTPETAEPMQAMLRLTPRDQVDWLGATLIGLPSHLARFAAAFPGDIWASHALPDLRQWLQTRQGAMELQLPPEWDFLAKAGLAGYPTSAGHLLNIAARASVPPRRAVCIVATARNEGLYLLEWVAYHRLIGADALFVYSNDNSDGSDDLLRALAQAGEITWIENCLNIGNGAQPKAYGHAFGVLPGVLDYRWSLVIDLDEFFAFDASRFRSLIDYIDWQETQRVDAVSLNWLVYGSNGEAAWSDAPMVERFTKRLPWIDPHIKSLSRSNLCMQSHPHHATFPALTPIVTRDSEGGHYQYKDGFSFAAAPSSDKAWVSHYFLKSAEEFVWKFSRNRGDHALVRELDPALIDTGFASMFIQQHQSPTMIEDRRTTLCAPDLGSEIARLRRLPAVQAAEATIVDGYARHIGGLVDKLRRAASLAEPGSPFPPFARLCR